MNHNNVISAGAKELSGRTLCCAQLGLALVLTVETGGRRHKLLFDAGPEGDLFLRNCRNLGVSLADVAAIAISHGHWDHMGALLDAIRHIVRENQGRPVPCHVNPGMFLERGARLTTGQVAPFEPVPSPADLAAHGARMVNDGASRLLVEDCFYLSGEIPRVTTFEKGRPDHLCRPSPAAPWGPDPLIMDERYLAVHVRDKGLVVFSACSHAGIVNVLLHAREAFPDVPLYGALGGLHLSGAGPERLIPETVANLGQFGLKNLVYGLSGIGGNAATRVEAFTASTGSFAYGGYPDIDALFRDQAGELDPKKREALLHRIQQLMHDKVMYLPIWQLSMLQGYGPRVAESGFGLIADYPWAAPYEDLKLKPK